VREKCQWISSQRHEIDERGPKVLWSQTVGTIYASGWWRVLPFLSENTLARYKECWPFMEQFCARKRACFKFAFVFFFCIPHIIGILPCRSFERRLSRWHVHKSRFCLCPCRAPRSGQNRNWQKIQAPLRVSNYREYYCNRELARKKCGNYIFLF